MSDSEFTVTWHSPANPPFRINGFAWYGEEGKYRRLPQAPRVAIPPAVDKFANCASGGQIRFRTDSSGLALRVKLSGLADLNHMPATSQCGFDCYIDIGERQLFHSSSRYDRTKQDYEIVMYQKMERRLRDVTLYFPLYQGVEEVSVGLDRDGIIAEPAAYASDKRVVVYGTSITQGASAARPGMSYTNILSRRIPLEFINLGFSASGRGEPEVAMLVGDIPNPACLVLDYEANCPRPEHLEKTLPEFIRIYRDAHPDVPILVVSKIRYARELFDDALLNKRLSMQAIQRETVERLNRHGDQNVFFYDGSGLLGDHFHECTVDGVHPTDLGFMRIADGLTPVLQKLLE
ncbi:SGNH/GDSL hydrolase family protein [Paenibacillus sp. GYB004]|uniref:SGNH/GDSL hydrolase family protein n=1 Tax=Paenibacillus sp. GYB004 TaxID=2994393 RepID=UPI002F96B4B1